MSDDVSFRPEETLGDFVKYLWAGRGFIIAGVIVGVLAGFAFVSAAVPHERASMILAPASPMNMTAVSSARLGTGAGGVAPVNITNDASFTRFEASYKGSAVAGLLLRDPEITSGLAKDKSFKFSSAEKEWTPEKLADYIAERVSIDPIGETDLRAFSYLHPEQAFAVTFLTRIHNVTDGLIRYGLRKDVNERVSYLNDAIAETMNPDHRRALADLLMEQERLKMLVSIDQPYAASVVVPPAPSIKGQWPDVPLSVLAFMFAGAFLGYVAFSLRYFSEDDFLQKLPIGNIRQEGWVFPKSGNNNEKPENKPLTGKKAKKTPSKKSKKAAPPEAAE